MRIKIWLGEKYKQTINSKPFIFLLGLAIGAAYLFIWTEAPGLYNYIATGHAYAMDSINPDKGSLATAGENQGIGGAVEGVRHNAPISPASLLELYDWDVKTAKAIMLAESNGEADRIGDKHLVYADGRYGMSCGLFQIRVLQGRPSCDELLDPQKNIEFAYGLYKKSGWEPWSVWKNESYKKFL